MDPEPTNNDHCVNHLCSCKDKGGEKKGKCQ